MVSKVDVLNEAATEGVDVESMGSTAGTLLGAGERSVIISMTSVVDVGVEEGITETESVCPRV